MMLLTRQSEAKAAGLILLRWWWLLRVKLAASIAPLTSAPDQQL